MSALETTQGFVVSSGRCGSTLLSNILREHPEILSLSEVFSVLGGGEALALGVLSGAELGEWLARPRDDMRQLLSAAKVPEILLLLEQQQLANTPGPLLVTLPHLSPQPHELWQELRTDLATVPRLPVGRHYERLFDWLCAHLGRRQWIERSGGSIEYVDTLVKNFPRARFVHLIRDGRDSAHSMAQHPMFRVRLARLLARQPLMPVERCLAQTLPIDRFGAYWSSLMLHAWRVARTNPSRHLVLRYEVLVAEPRHELSRVARFLGHTHVPEGWLARAQLMIRPTPSRWQALPAPERMALERACSPGMRMVERWADAEAARTRCNT